MTNITPAPWFIDWAKASTSESLPLIMSPLGCVAEILGSVGSEEERQRGYYDAHLIRSAPELLAACQQALAVIDYGASTPPVARLRAAHDLLTVALTKAKGINP